MIGAGVSSANQSPSPIPRVAHFGPYALDFSTAELSKAGQPIKTQEQPLRLLILLVERAGQTLTRNELHAAIWPAGTFVEFEAGLNTAVKKIRQVLSDSAEDPKFVETVPRQGYRFIAAVHYSMPAQEPRPTFAAAPESGVPTRTAVLRRLRPWVAAVGVSLLATAGWLATRPARLTAKRALRFTIDLPEGHTLSQNGGTSMAISPDGQVLVFSLRGSDGRPQLWQRPFNDVEAHPIPGTGGIECPFYSPDGRFLAGFSEQKLRRFTLQGEVADLAVLSAGIPSRNATWGSDGYIYFSDKTPFDTTAPGGNRLAVGIWRIREDGTRPAELVEARESAGPGVDPAGVVWQFPNQMLSNGELLYTSVRSPSDRRLMLLNLATRKTRLLEAHGAAGRVLPSGHLLYFQAGQLFAAPFQSLQDSLPGASVPVLSDAVGAGWSAAEAAISLNGTLVYLGRGSKTEEERLVWVDLSGKESALPLLPGRYQPLDLSHHGRQLLLTRYDPAEDKWSLWSCDLAGGAWTRRAGGSSRPINAIWSPDDREIVFASDHDGREFQNLFRQKTDDPGGGELLTSAPFGQYPQSWSPDGQTIAFAEGQHPSTGADILLLSMAGGSRPRMAIEGPLGDYQATFSPDGRWLAYATQTPSSMEVRVQSSTSTGVPISVAAGDSPVWAPDGRELYFRAGKQVMAVAFRSGPPPSAGEPRLLFQGDYIRANSWYRSLILSSDGRRFLLARPIADKAGVQRLNVALNWLDELKRLSP